MTPRTLSPEDEATLRADWQRWLQYDPDVTYEQYRDRRIAKVGHRWVCAACGKTAIDSHGGVGEHSPGWDESCMLNADQWPDCSLEYGADGSRVIAIRGTP